MSPENTDGSGLYVDVENLRSDEQRQIKNLLENWPSVAPPPTRLCVFVKADLVELWRLWTTSQFPNMEVAVRGIQHFSADSSKNSADIAIATSAIADLLLGRVKHVVVFSDDSDFISLFITIRDELSQSLKTGGVPFLWVVTDREDSVSRTVKEFFPRNYLHVIESQGVPSRNLRDASVPEDERIVGSPGQSSDAWEDIAQRIIDRIPVGLFKSTDCQKVIKEYRPRDPLAAAEGPAFGIEFKKNVWPILERRGVIIANPGKKPIRYEMTQAAKRQ